MKLEFTAEDFSGYAEKNSLGPIIQWSSMADAANARLKEMLADGVLVKAHKIPHGHKEQWVACELGWPTMDTHRARLVEIEELK